MLLKYLCCELKLPEGQKTAASVRWKNCVGVTSLSKTILEQSACEASHLRPICHFCMTYHRRNPIFKTFPNEIPQHLSNP